MRILKSGAAALAIVFILVAPPVLLVSFVGNPYPDGGTALNAPLSDAAILGILAVLTWILWTQLVVCLIAEALAVLTDRPVGLHLPVFAFQRDLARGLLTALLVTTVTAPLWSTTIAHASTPIATSTADSVHPSSAASDATSETSHRDAHGQVPRPIASPLTASTTATGAATTDPQGGRPAATVTPSAEDRPSKNVTVARGDTLWSLAEEHLGDGTQWTAIAAANRGRSMTDGSTFTSADFIRPGWTLLIPARDADQPAAAPARDYRVQAGDTLWSIADNELGDGSRYPDLFTANQGLPQPGGQALTDPDLIEPRWQLRIPQPGRHPNQGRSHDIGSRDPHDHSADPHGGRVIDLPPHPHHTPTTSPERDDPPADQRHAGHPTRPTTASPSQAAGTTEEAQRATPATEADASEGITPLRSLLATGLCLAGGLGMLLLGRRARQWRERRPGRTLAPLPAALRTAERAILEASTLAGDDVQFLDQALRHLALLHHQHQLPLPDVRAVALSADGLELRADVSAEPSAPSPAPEALEDAANVFAASGWTVDETAGIWRLPRTFRVDPDLVAAQPAPYPSLVTIGVDQASHTSWLLDLETIGDLTIAGDPHRVDDLQRYLAAELAVSPWTHGIQVLLVDPALHAIAALQSERLLATDAERATQRAFAALDGAPLGAALLAARRDRHADGTSPLVIITSDHIDVERSESGRGDRRQRISQVRPADTNATLTMHGDHLTLQPEGITLTALLLTKAQADTLTGVSQALADAADAPVPNLAGAGALEQVARADGTLRISQAVRKPATLGSSLLPKPDDVYLAAAATTEEDLANLAPPIPTAIADRVQALDPTLDGDLADWHDPECQRPKVQVLGPVSVTGHGPNKDTVNSLASTIEFIVYLACRERGVTPDRAAADLGWSEHTTWNRALDARRYLGQRPDSTEWLPEAPKSPTARTRGVATYELHPDVLVSADLFRRLRLRGQARGGCPGIHDLAAALNLVDGAPFDQLRRGGYGWLLEGDRLDHHLTAAVIDTAHLVVTAALTSGDMAQARQACEVAIMASPHADGPQLDMAAVLAAEGAPELNTHVRQAILEQHDEDDPPARTKAILQRRDWLAS